MVEEKKVPKGYKMTEVGIIPEDWVVKRLGEIAEIRKGKQKNKDTLFYKDEYPVINGGIKPSGYTSDWNTKENTITISEGGSCGYVNFIKTKFWSGGHCYTVHIKNDDLNNLFLYYLLKYRELEIMGLRVGSGLPNIQRKSVEEFEITYIEDIKEQKAIAEALSDVDNLITSLEKLIDKKRQIKQGTMQQLLTGKKRLPGFTGEWENKKLVDLLDYEQPSKYIIKTDILEKGTTPVLTANKSFLLGFTEEEYGKFTDIPVILFDDFTTLSKIVKFPFKVKSSALKILKPKNQNVNLNFVYEKMQLIKFAIGDHKRYYLSQYQYIDVMIPNKDEQDAISQILTDIDSEIEALEKKLEKYKAIKQGMMQELLTGRIRLV